MSNAAWLLLQASYVLPLALLAWVVVGRDVSRPRATLLLLLALPFFYLSHHLVSGHLAGLPSGQPVPDAFTLLGFTITEPDSRTGNPGEILLWLRGDSVPAPRVHRLPYARGLHESLRNAGERSAAGTTQVGVRRPAGRSTGPDNGRSDDSYLQFKDEDPAIPPAKEST